MTGSPRPLTEAELAPEPDLTSTRADVAGSLTAGYRSLPLTSFEVEALRRAGLMEPLFSGPAPEGMRQIRVTVSVPGAVCTPADIVATEDDVEKAFAVAWKSCRKLGEFEIRVGPLSAGAREG